MPYSTPAQVAAAAGGEAYFLQLVDPDHTGSANTDELAAAQREAEGWMDTYLQRRILTPLAEPIPAAIQDMAAHETVYRLMRRRQLVADWAETAHRERLDWLKALAMGNVSVGVEPELQKSSAVVPDTFERSPLEAVSRRSLKGFW